MTINDSITITFLPWRIQCTVLGSIYCVNAPLLESFRYNIVSFTDLGPSFCESLRCQMDQTPPTNNQLCNYDAALDQAEKAVSEEGDELLIQSNEEDIQPLADREDIGIDGVSGECDSTGNLPCKQPSKLVN